MVGRSGGHGEWLRRGERPGFQEVTARDVTCEGRVATACTYTWGGAVGRAGPGAGPPVLMRAALREAGSQHMVVT